MISPELYTLGLSHPQLVEIHRALLARFVVEDAMRREQGLEPAEYPKLLEHIETLLKLDPETAHRVFHKEEDELWEYSWYTFTDEWAWYRAKQDALKERGAKAKRTPSKVIEARMEELYEEKFDHYTSELSMEESTESTTRSQRRRIPRKRP